MQDPAKAKAVLCPRRAGKSWTALAYAMDTALRKPGSVTLIVSLTLKTAKSNYWNVIVPRFIATYGLSANLHHTDLRITLSNGSFISFVGAETRAEIDKIRGASYDLVIIDECKSYALGVFEELVNEAVKPALHDRGGTLMMIGTPGNVMDGLFYKATGQGVTDDKGRPFSRTYDDPEPFWQQNPKARIRWSRHSWSRKENTKTEENLWQKALDEKDDNAWADDNPIWLREYLGQWVAASDCFVYSYASLYRTEPEKVHWHPQITRDNPSGLPVGQDWRFVCGIDLGYEDATAAVVAAYSPTDGSLYHVWDYKESHLDIYKIADLLQAAWDRFGGFDAMVADAGALGKLVVETLAQRHGLPIQPAEKREKFDHIELVNADFLSGRIKLIPSSDLAIEMAGLQFYLEKDTKANLAKQGKLREHPALPNHLCDAFLYLHRFCNHYWARPKRKEANYGTPEWRDQMEEESIDRMLARRDNPVSFWEGLSDRGSSPLSRYTRYGTR